VTPALEPVPLALALRALSLGFTAPDAPLLAELRELAAALGSPGTLGDAALAELFADLALALDDDELTAALPAAHERLFGGAVRCSPYEGSYEADPFRSTRQLADLAGIYRAFGAGTGGPAAERADHVGCQLEFLSFLVARRVQAECSGDTAHGGVCREAEDALLSSHLGRFLPPFVREVLAEATSPVHRLLALAAERLLVGELARRGLEVRPLVRRSRTAVEHDALECGGDDVLASRALSPSGERRAARHTGRAAAANP
jgi:TorA maturation chaperone TorD